MTQRCLVEPDVNFVKQIVGLGGETLKKCFQCATCSVACPISPDNKPFPRKEMMAASWGLKDRLVKNGDIWLCHQCGDCSTLCPRGARPGDVLSAVRSYAISEYALSKRIGEAVNNPKKLHILLGIPTALFAVLAFITVFCGGTMSSIFHAIGLEWSHGGHDGVIAHADFISTWFVDLVFVPLALWVIINFLLGLKRFIVDIHENAVLEGKTDKEDLNIKKMIQALIKVIPAILRHDKFSQCSENKDREISHMMVLYSFIGLFVVTNIFFFVLYVFHIPGPYSQLNPVKWLANISGIFLVIGGGLMIKSRLSKTDQTTVYKDWYLLGLVLGLGITGLLSEMTRMAGLAGVTYGVYLIHLVLVFNLFAFLPYSKLAHVVYRTVALTYAEYGNRK